MKATKRGWTHAGAAAVLMLGSVACNAVLGLDEREYDPCPVYCADIQQVCTGDAAQYDGATVCEAACAALNELAAEDASEHPVDCRYFHLDVASEAKDSGDENARLDACGKAGFGSIDSNGLDACGDPCDLYCTLMPAYCAETSIGRLDVEQCRTACAQFEAVDDWTAGDSFDKELGDTLQCRMWHLANAMADSVTHCPHAAGETKCNTSS